MSEKNAEATENATEAERGGDAAATEPEKTFTQEQLDEIVRKRVARVKREKPADYDELKEKVEQYEKAESESESEFEKLQKRLGKLEDENKAMKHAAEVSRWKAEASEETGVPASILRGDTQEDIKAHAEAVKSVMEHATYPAVDPGNPAGGKLTKADVDSIKDPVERVKARARLIQQD